MLHRSFATAAHMVVYVRVSSIVCSHRASARARRMFDTQCRTATSMCHRCGTAASPLPFVCECVRVCALSFWSHAALELTRALALVSPIVVLVPRSR